MESMTNISVINFMNISNINISSNSTSVSTTSFDTAEPDRLADDDHAKLLDIYLHCSLKIVFFILIIGGTFGNILSIVILRHACIGPMPTKIYLITLAVLDLLCVDFSMLDWLLHLYDVDIRDMNDIGCKITMYFKMVLLVSSYWTQVVISLDRCFGITFPFKYHKIKRKHRVITMIGIIVFFVAFESPRLFYYKLVYDSPAHPECINTDAEFSHYLDNYWIWMDFTIAFLVPLVTMSLCSVVMVRYLSATRRAIGDYTNNEAEDTARKTTKLFIALNLVFLITNLPKRIVAIVFGFGDNRIISHDIYMKYVWDITWVIMYSSHSVNFIFYVLHVPKFRTIFKIIFCRCFISDELHLKMLSSSPMSPSFQPETFRWTGSQQTIFGQASSADASFRRSNSQQTSSQRTSSQQTRSQQTSCQHDSSQETDSQQIDSKQLKKSSKWTSSQQTNSPQTSFQLTSSQPTSSPQTSYQQPSSQETDSQQTSSKQTSYPQTAEISSHQTSAQQTSSSQTTETSCHHTSSQETSSPQSTFQLTRSLQVFTIQIDHK